MTTRPSSREDFPGAVDSILNGLPALIGYWDTELRNKLANDAYVEYFGLTPEQIYGLHIREVLGEDLYAKNLPFLKRALAGERQMFDREIPTPGGGKRYTQASYIPDIVDGQVRGIFVLVTDISQRRMAELEAQEARLAAQAANRAKTDFLARVSHEFRTPLMSLLGFVDLMRDSELPPRALEELNYIERSARQLSSLVDDLLDSASLATGRLSLTPSAVAVSAVMQDVIALLGPLADERNIVLELATPADAATAWVDPNRLKQVALNLLSNAIKYGPRDAPVEVRVTGDKDDVTVTIRDNGTPLTPEECLAIFEPMVRLGKSNEAGTGLGLPLSRSLAEAMGGSLSVEAGETLGNTFVLTVPACDAAPSEKVAEDAATPSARALRLSVNLSRVLYVEDNLDNLGLVSAMLSRFADVEVIPASQGHMALDLARVHVPNAILLDVDLRDISGPELVRLLRSDERTSAVPIIAIGAEMTASLAEDLQAAEVTVFLKKPFTIEDLFAALSHIAR